MAIVEKFYNHDRARDIRELLTSNFDNVARYIPNNFLSLTTIERQNITDDYKTHFKLVFDKEKERVYRWSEIKRNWEQYLIYAWDEYARTEANTNADKAFAEVELGINEQGATDPYTFTFYNRAYDETNGSTGKTIHHPKQAKDSVTLTGLNVKFNNDYSVTTIIQKILNDFKSLNDFVGNRTDITNNADLTAKTVCGAIKEINNKTITNKNRIDNIMNGSTKVPEAIHSERADLADIATKAKDSERLGGQLPNYYAKQSDLINTNNLLNDTINRVTKNESDIVALQDKTNKTNSDLAALDARENTRYQEYLTTKDAVNTNIQSISDLEDNFNSLASRIGWEILF